jgi:hypothetical protein
LDKKINFIHEKKPLDEVLYKMYVFPHLPKYFGGIGTTALLLVAGFHRALSLHLS